MNKIDYLLKHFIEDAKSELLSQPNSSSDEFFLKNGRVYEVLRDSVPEDGRRTSGTYLTSNNWAERAARLAFENSKSSSLKVVDPACGMGDLLLAAARCLPTGKTLTHTLNLWSELLSGFDLKSEFVEIAKLRLIYLARQRGNFLSDPIPEIASTFENIRVFNAFDAEDEIRNADRIMLNPPYGQVKPPNSPKWAAGIVTEAALFVEHIAKAMKPQATITAILPEVLRCGARYQKWRDAILVDLKIEKTRTLGTFDEWTDVDVFMIRCVKQTVPNGTKVRTHNWGIPRGRSKQTVSDQFDIKVGTVVPHRDRMSGPVYPYIEARILEPWSKAKPGSVVRKYEGYAFNPPFVAIRRTSRPGDKFRAVGTIVVGKEPVAVENHLIVATPKTGTARECSALLRQLKTQSTNYHLNSTMKCRHLTVGSVKSIPWDNSDG